MDHRSLNFCCCCLSILPPPNIIRCYLLTKPHTGHGDKYLLFGHISTCFGASSDLKFLQISSNFLVVWLFKFVGCSKPPSSDTNNKASYTRKEPRYRLNPDHFYTSRGKNDASILSLALPIFNSVIG